jgi:hypothetical protein
VQGQCNKNNLNTPDSTAQTMCIKRFEQMASIQKRKNKNGTSHWRAVVRLKGYPTVCNHFDRKQEAED